MVVDVFLADIIFPSLAVVDDIFVDCVAFLPFCKFTSFFPDLLKNRTMSGDGGFIAVWRFL